jgi:hypothetical protein
VKTRLCFSFIALAIIAGCARHQTPPDDSAKYQERFLQEKADYEPNLGKNFWALMDMAMCPVPTLIEDAKCETVAKGSKLQPDAIEEGSVGTAYYHVKLEDGRAGYISAHEVVHLATQIDPMQTAADCIRRGEPRVGMSRQHLEATCWGKPIRVDRRETARGVSERYVYGKTRFVLLHNGVVTSVQFSGRLR